MLLGQAPQDEPAALRACDATGFGPPVSRSRRSTSRAGAELLFEPCGAAAELRRVTLRSREVAERARGGERRCGRLQVAGLDLDLGDETEEEPLVGQVATLLEFLDPAGCALPSVVEGCFGVRPGRENLCDRAQLSDRVLAAD